MVCVGNTLKGEKMSFNKLASIVAKREGKKKSINIAQIKEFLRILIDLQVECYMEDGGAISPIRILIAESSKRIRKLEAKRNKRR